MINLFMDGKNSIKSNPIEIKTGLLKNPTGTPDDFFDVHDDKQYKFSFLQNTSTISSQTTIGNWEPIIGFRMMNVYGGLAVNIDSPIVKMWGGANSKVQWSDELVFKSDYDKLLKRVEALESKIGGVNSLLTHIRRRFNYVAFNRLEVA